MTPRVAEWFELQVGLNTCCKPFGEVRSGGGKFNSIKYKTRYGHNCILSLYRYKIKLSLTKGMIVLLTPYMYTYICKSLNQKWFCFIVFVATLKKC